MRQKDQEGLRRSETENRQLTETTARRRQQDGGIKGKRLPQFVSVRFFYVWCSHAFYIDGQKWLKVVRCVLKVNSWSLLE